MKIANDIRWLGSGPRAGLGELMLPANEPGSSIMPGKVNPTQCEAMVMVCIAGDRQRRRRRRSPAPGELRAERDAADHHRQLPALGRASSADACETFRRVLRRGRALNRRASPSYVDRSLMLVTALSPVIGYDKAAEIAHRAEPRRVRPCARRRWRSATSPRRSSTGSSIRRRWSASFRRAPRPGRSLGRPGRCSPRETVCMVGEMEQLAPYTVQSLGSELRALGLTSGDTVLAHSSASSLGFVAGGTQAVVQALLDVLGPDGTLVVPTHTPDNTDPADWRNPPVPESWWPVIRRRRPGSTSPGPRAGGWASSPRPFAPGRVRCAAIIRRCRSPPSAGMPLRSLRGTSSPTRWARARRWG